jgi:hypothetical protein
LTLGRISSHSKRSHNSRGLHKYFLFDSSNEHGHEPFPLAEVLHTLGRDGSPPSTPFISQVFRSTDGDDNVYLYELQTRVQRGYDNDVPI